MLNKSVPGEATIRLVQYVLATRERRWFKMKKGNTSFCRKACIVGSEGSCFAYHIWHNFLFFLECATHWYPFWLLNFSFVSWYSLLSRYGIHSVPSIVLVNETSRMRYHGPKNLASLVEFYQRVTGICPLIFIPGEVHHGAFRWYLISLPWFLLQGLNLFRTLRRIVQWVSIDYHRKTCYKESLT